MTTTATTPAISVIVPVYNTERYLRRCIDSILAQTFTDFELLLIDDGSTDTSPAICDEYAQRDPRVRVFHKPNGGVSSARNLGLDNALGEWISFVDADDWVDDAYFEKLIKKSISQKADIVFCDSYFEYPDKQLIHQHYNWEKQGDEGLAEFITSTWTCIWGSIQKRSLYVIHNLQSPPNICYCEDFHLVVRLCYYASIIAKVSEPLYHYRQQASSVMHNLNQKTQNDEIQAYSEIINFFKILGKYDYFKRVMAWRSLKASQGFALNAENFNDFILYNPDKRNYILGCPFINKKLQLNMWFLTHHLSFLSLFFVLSRKFLNR